MAEPDPHPRDLEWDLEERNRLLEDGTLLDENAPDPTDVAVESDE